MATDCACHRTTRMRLRFSSFVDISRVDWLEKSNYESGESCPALIHLAMVEVLHREKRGLEVQWKTTSWWPDQDVRA